MPLLWRHADAAAALSRVAARALIGCQRVGDVVHGDLAMHIAAETFTIRFLCGFGENLPDGVVPLDDIFESDDEPPAIERQGDACRSRRAAHLRHHGGRHRPGRAQPCASCSPRALRCISKRAPQPDAVFLGAIAAASFASLASMILPWLLSGGTLVLHHPFAPAVFARQRAEENCAVAVLPGPMVMRLAEAGLIGERDGETVLAVWRAPERLHGERRPGPAARR